MNDPRNSIRPLLSVTFAACLAVPALGCSTPEKPSINPEGPNETVKPGGTQLFVADSAGATQYEWQLQGAGEIPSSVRGNSILFSAPNEGGRIAILTVIAHNWRGASPPNSVTINIPVIGAQLDSYGIPAAWMSGTGSPEDYIDMDLVWSRCQSVPSCQKVTFTPGGVWAGVYWWPAECGETGSKSSFQKAVAGDCRINLLQLSNLKSIMRISFWAKGEKGKEIVEFKVGGKDIAPTPARTKKLTLSSEWQRYEIPLNETDMTNAVGLFMWAATDNDNPQGATFYLDDIVFEGSR
jgi:hypothetical protein